ncbi:glutathione S-transferase 1-like [Amphibalanus amphitrite]|uniref:glutathione S-transferase 1-like n=1 Tax=Amphibalanus amphitrite TaxID=1232801 RepID=UPI001C9265C4|nr:glutathione S-transferase 1-like [Amphibalanus amphitrite]
MESEQHPSPELTDEQLAAAIAEPPVSGEWKLYWDAVPPPSQAVLLTLSCLPELRRRVRLVRVNVLRSQQLTAAFRALSPLHQVPLLEAAGGSVLTESRAIMAYLAEEAGPAGAALLPDTVRGRAAGLRWTLFDVTCLYPRLKEYHLPVMAGRAGRPPADALPPLAEALAVLDAELQRTPYLAGEAASLADLGLAVTVAQARAVGVPLTHLAAVGSWYERLRLRLPGLQHAERGSAQYAATLQRLMDAWERRHSPDTAAERDGPREEAERRDSEGRQ